MERMKTAAHLWRPILFFALAALGTALLWDVILAILRMVLAASALMLLALPLCKQLEKRLPAGAAAGLSLAMLLVGLVLLLMGLLPPVVRQMQTLTGALPHLAESLQGALSRLTLFLEGRGIDLIPLRDGFFGQITTAAGGLVTRAMGMATGIVSGLSKVLLSPLMAFYLLRDRRKFAACATLLLPVGARARGVRAAREMKRETAAFLRGQLLLSLAVGGMTAAGLLLTGTPGWLLLGVLMGVMELVPYIGPVIAGAPAVLLALQGGLMRAVWTLIVLAAVQELEGAVLSPRLVGEATALHPLTVLILVTAGGMIAGALGMVLVIPLVVSIRGALRGWRE